jgi:ABC-type lipoprotein release transport system permease subunit
MNITLTLAWRNLWRHRRRTWLTVSAMVFCNVLLIFSIALQFGTYGLMIENSLKLFTGHLQIQHPKYLDSPKLHYSIDDAAKLQTQLQQELGENWALASRGMGFALVSSEERSFGIQVVGVEPGREPMVSSLPGLVKSGNYLPSAPTETIEIVIGRKIADNLKVELGDELTLLGSGRDGSFAAGIAIVTGIFDSGVSDIDRAMAQIPLDDFQTLFTMEQQVHSIVIQGSSAANADALQERLRQWRASHVEQSFAPVWQPRHWDELLPGVRQAIQSDIASSLFLYSILTLLVAFSVLNTQLMSVLERTREFGILSALGISPGQLGRLVMLETLLMASLGFALGVLLGAIIVYAISQVGISFPGMEEMHSRFNMPARIYPELSMLPLTLGPAVILVGSLLASLYPALRLQRLEPVAAMRAA